MKKCPYVDNCPMFKLFHNDFSKAAYRLIYCLFNFDKCVRKPKRDRGENVPDNLLPDGRIIDK